MFYLRYDFFINFNFESVPPCIFEIFIFVDVSLCPVGYFSVDFWPQYKQSSAFNAQCKNVSMGDGLDIFILDYTWH